MSPVTYDHVCLARLCAMRVPVSAPPSSSAPETPQPQQLPVLPTTNTLYVGCVCHQLSPPAMHGHKGRMICRYCSRGLWKSSFCDVLLPTVGSCEVTGPIEGNANGLSSFIFAKPHSAPLSWGSVLRGSGSLLRFGVGDTEAKRPAESLTGEHPRGERQFLGRGGNNRGGETDAFCRLPTWEEEEGV